MKKAGHLAEKKQYLLRQSLEEIMESDDVSDQLARRTRSTVSNSTFGDVLPLTQKEKSEFMKIEANE